MSNSPLVSICCLTYNHEPYIRDCLEGFVMQQTNFIFEVLIHDDASTDNTAAIIREYEVKYPSIIKPIYQTENQYSKGVKVTSVYNFPRVKGQYVAMCEGDDYWTDPLKLQKQVDFLENNNDYGLVYTKTKVFFEGSKKFKKTLFGLEIPTKGILFNNPIPTLTTLLRKDILQGFLDSQSDEVPRWQMGDYPIWIYFYYHSEIYFLNEVTGVRRMLLNSASNFSDGSKRMRFIKNGIQMSRFYAKKYLDEIKFSEFINYRLKSYYISALIYDFKNSKIYYDEIRGEKNIQPRVKFYLFIVEKLKIKYVLLLLIRFKSLILN